MTYDTGLSGQGISIAPHVASDMNWTSPIATFDYGSASLYDDNHNLIAGIYN